MSEGLTIILGTIIGLILGGLIWIILVRITKLAEHKVASISTAVGTTVSILFIFSVTRVELDSIIVALFAILVSSTLVANYVKTTQSIRNKKKKK